MQFYILVQHSDEKCIISCRCSESHFVSDNDAWQSVRKSAIWSPSHAQSFDSMDSHSPLLSVFIKTILASISKSYLLNLCTEEWAKRSLKTPSLMFSIEHKHGQLNLTWFNWKWLRTANLWNVLFIYTKFM
jgi:hypothetical protein